MSFVPDVSEEALGEGLVRVRRLGIRSSLRVPVVIAGQAELVLIVSWETMVSRPDSSTLVLVRRFADQAGLALEQVERRRAEAEATRRAVEARRLHEMTAALAKAATPAQVGGVCLEHTRLAVGADGGFLVRAPVEGTALGVLSSDGDVGSRRPGALASSPTRRSPATIRSGEPVWALDGDGPTSAGSEGRRACAAFPLRSGSRVLAAVQLVFREGLQPTAELRDRLDVDRRAVRARARAELPARLRASPATLSERLQRITAELSNALTRADVARVLLDHVDEAVGTECAVLVVLGEGLGPTELLGWSGFEEDEAERWLDVPMDAGSPQGHAIRRLAPNVYDASDDEEDVDRFFDPAGTGHRSFLFVPLVLGRRPLALLVASSRASLDLAADDLRFVAALAGQAAQALDRARRFESEQRIAETLQQSVLPASLPALPGVQLAGRYLPGTAELEVGGDWYDAIVLPNGRLGLVVGDVVGKGVQGSGDDGAAPQRDPRVLARPAEAHDHPWTAQPARRGGDRDLLRDRRLRRARSRDGRVPVCIRRPPAAAGRHTGRSRRVPRGRPWAPARNRNVDELPPGRGGAARTARCCVFYTDGLIERRGRSLDEGFERLRAAVATGRGTPIASRRTCSII